MRVSDFFGLQRTQPYLDFVDVRLDTDVPVFVDPSAIRTLESPWGHDCTSLIQHFFETLLKRIRNGNNVEAKRLLASLNERNEFHLGYSSGKSRGHGFGSKSAGTVWGALTTSSASASGLLQDLEDTALLVEGVGTDMVSDAVCNIIRGPLLKYTQDMCIYYGIPLTPGVPSGPIWNPDKETWDQGFVPLPVTDFGKLVLVPKIIVRQKLWYQADQYYRHYLLPEMQHEHLNANSALVHTLRDGSPRVYKKELIAKYGADKLAIVRETLKRPHVLAEYKTEKEKRITSPMTHAALADVEASEAPNWEGLVNELKAIPPGRDFAGAYEDAVEKLLTALFYPSLCSPTKQHKIHEGRKRIDITYCNEAKSGFFYWLSLHYPAAFVFVECKNYGKDIGNPEIDQLSGRFSNSRGKFGLLVFRDIQDKDLLRRRCADTAKDGRGFVIALDDEDLRLLVEELKANPEAPNFDILRQQFNQLVG